MIISPTKYLLYYRVGQALHARLRVGSFLREALREPPQKFNFPAFRKGWGHRWILNLYALSLK